MFWQTKKAAPLTKADLLNTRKSILEWTRMTEEGDLVLTDQTISLADGDDDVINYLNSVIKTIPRSDQYPLLSDFNYHYNSDGELVNIDTGKKFHWVNQEHYDALGDIVYRHIQGLMVKDYGLEEVLLPLQEDYEGPTNNIFVSSDWKTATKLMLLIQGSGAVRPGQWARALCMNDNLKVGSILPYLDRCKEAGYSVIVFNPNQNFGCVNPQDENAPCSAFLIKPGEKGPRRNQGPKAKIPGNESNVEHCLYVWDHFVTPAEATIIGAVAHSAGGHCAQMLVEKRNSEASKRLYGIAFTDSVHGVSRRDPEEVKHFIQKRCRNWVRSDEPLDTKIHKPSNDCLCVSAGHDKHEWTSGIAIDSVFGFLFAREAAFPTEDPNDDNYDQM